VNDPAWALYEDVVHQALARNGAGDPGPALCALLWLLRDRHRADFTAFVTMACREGFELPDPRAGTVAERIRDQAAGTAGRRDTEGGYNDPTVTRDTESIVSGMRVVADVLGELIPVWDSEAMAEAAADDGPSGAGRPACDPGRNRARSSPRS
jgi:hypothetical protein